MIIKIVPGLAGAMALMSGISFKKKLGTIFLTSSFIVMVETKGSKGYGLVI